MKNNFFKVLTSEITRLDNAQSSKRQEVVISGFTKKTTTAAPMAIVKGKKYQVFNSNDYLGLRHDERLKKAEHAASQKYGTGPGAVRFISGSLQVHKDLEKALAKFHGRDDAMIFSSAFAANLGVLFSLIKGQSKESLLQSRALVISDELNHRSIIDGIRLANLASEEKAIFKHMDATDLDRVLKENLGKFERCLVVSDGIFSMLGEYQDLKALAKVIAKYDTKYLQGVLLVVDDAHGVAACGKTGRGVEELSGQQADVLIGTLGKAWGADGGYVAADQVVIDYLREAGATYIYSNNISPGTAGAALAAVKLMSSASGQKILANLQKNIAFFKQEIKKTKFTLAAKSDHPIQPVLIGDAKKAKELKLKLFAKNVLVTNINYPVVPQGRDEIRVQISAVHTKQDIKRFVERLLTY